MEWNGSIPEEWNGSIPTFGLDKKEEWNGTIFCSVGVIWRVQENEIKVYFFCLKIVINSGKWPF
jgi:hypothetical protein